MEYFEKVEKLVQRAGVSYEDAKAVADLVEARFPKSSSCILHH